MRHAVMTPQETLQGHTMHTPRANRRDGDTAHSVSSDDMQELLAKVEQEMPGSDMHQMLQKMETAELRSLLEQFSDEEHALTPAQEQEMQHQNRLLAWSDIANADTYWGEHMLPACRAYYKATDTVPPVPSVQEMEAMSAKLMSDDISKEEKRAYAQKIHQQGAWAVNPLAWPCERPYKSDNCIGGFTTPWEMLAGCYDIACLRAKFTDADGKVNSKGDCDAPLQIFAACAMALRAATGAAALSVQLDIGDIVTFRARAATATSMRHADSCEAGADQQPVECGFDRIHMNNVPDYAGADRACALPEGAPSRLAHPQHPVRHVAVQAGGGLHICVTADASRAADRSTAGCHLSVGHNLGA